MVESQNESVDYLSEAMVHFVQEMSRTGGLVQSK